RKPSTPEEQVSCARKSAQNIGKGCTSASSLTPHRQENVGVISPSHLRTLAPSHPCLVFNGCETVPGMTLDPSVSRCRSARSLLFVPASRPAMIEKAAASAADAVCIDLEDSVVPGEKAAARGHVVQALGALDFGGRARIVRINGIDTPFAYRDLVDVVEAAGDRVDLIMIPKVGSPREIVFVDMLLSQIESSRGQRTTIGLEAQIETAQGFVYAREIAAASPRLDALIFGPGDYAASMRMPSSAIGERDEHDAAYPRARWDAAMH